MSAFTTRIVAAALACAGVILLTGCQEVDRTALRLNEDGSFDFATCHVLSSITDVNAVAYERADGELASSPVLTSSDLPSEVAPGDVIHLSAPSSDEWDQVSVVLEGVHTTRQGEGISWTIDGLFNRDDLDVGEWSWAKTGVFIGNVPVESCELIG
ncbi:hypothetical protein [Agromyces atrinae]|uniref:Lipoprotein n=1 Tax=Agromyces atrinae TaxID=592376 RepID=A0A4Q2M491_9MICO|nr:hypothetical protein [Agromyces atrinae]NYD66373.1 hypothetical protein [Agromyces atrinae]RXZ86689.1 hypothetical protein ESP50_09915 [Agromyces atrinae]